VRIRFSLDTEADALYVRLGQGKVERTVELDDLSHVDLDMASRPIGLEIVGLARDWPLDLFFDRFDVSQPTRTILETVLNSLRPAYVSVREERGQLLHLTTSDNTTPPASGSTSGVIAIAA
jgi:uncharacterized protein YuzE